MDVQIEDLISTVRSVDSDSLLAPQTMKKILEAVMQAVEEREEHRDRVRAEQHVSGGVSEELLGDR